MEHDSKLLRHQQRRIREWAQNSDAYDFFNILTGPELLDRVEELLPEHRERLYPPTETLSLFLAQALHEDGSCQRTVNESVVKRVRGGLSPCSTMTGGYCKARQRLPIEMVTGLVRRTADLMDEQTPEQWRWRGRRVRIIDGTTLSMPDTSANQARYPQQRGQQPGLGFPLCRVVGITCLSSGALIDAAIGRFHGKGASEQDLLRTLLDNFRAGDVALGDGFYGTYFLLAAMRERGVDIVFEQQGARKRSTDFRKGKKLGSGDHLIEISKPKIKPGWMSQALYDAAPESLPLRELRVGNKILITSLLCPKQVDKNALKALYKSRWQVELDLRNIKTTLGMETLSCKTPDMNEKEIWVYFLAYNLIRLLMAQAATLADVLPRQLSFKYTLQLWLSWKDHMPAPRSETNLLVLFFLIARKRIGKRPDRMEPRAIKRRPKPFALLMKPREQARAEIRKYGHPRKLK